MTSTDELSAAPFINALDGIHAQVWNIDPAKYGPGNELAIIMLRIDVLRIICESRQSAYAIATRPLPGGDDA